MITKIHGEQAFQVLTSAFSISPSASGYQLQISADGVNYSTLFSVGAGVTRLVTGVAANSYYRLAGNTSDVVVNWQKSCNGGEGGGGGTGTTITVDSELSTASTNPVENRVITNALNNIPSAEVDDELSSSSTNPVENRVIYEALNGVPVTTELVVLDTDSDWQLYANNFYNFKNTSIDKYKAFNLNNLETVPTYINLVNPTSSWLYFSPSTLTTSDIGVTKYRFANNGSQLYFVPENLDGTKEYYILLNTEEVSAMFYKTLPTSITEVTDHAALLSDIPIAQDNSDFKKYVYNSETESNKRVVSSVALFPYMDIASNRRESRIQISTNTWGGGSVSTNTGLIKGNECIDGVKTERDSQVISKAEEALNGLTEQVTLTIGNPSNDSINIQNSNYVLYKTDDQRYLVIPASADTSTTKTIYNVKLFGGTTYYIQNPMISSDYNRPVTGKYQLSTEPVDHNFNLRRLDGNNYIIIDKELLTLEIAESLTITRAKRVDNIVRDVATGYTDENRIVVTNAETAWNAYLATPDWSYSRDANFKETNYSNIVGCYVSDSDFLAKGLLTYGCGDGSITWIPPESITANTPDVRTQFIQTPGGGYSILPQSSPYYLLLDTVTGEFWFSFNPAVSTEVPGILDNYWTTGETQTAIQEALYGAIITGATTPIDDHLDSASTWPVENRVITNKFNDYYTKQETDALIQDMATEEYVDDAIAGIVIPEPPEDYATTGDVANAVEGLASESYVDNAVANLATTGDVANAVSGLASESYVNNAVGEVVQGLGMLGVVNDVALSGNTVTVKKTSASGSQMVTGSTQFDVVVPADITNMVESTSVRTMVKCTLAEYNAMATHDPNTFYIIVNS